MTTQPIDRSASRTRVVRRRWTVLGVALVLVASGWLVANNRHGTTVTPADPKPVTSATVLTAPRPGRDVSWRVLAGMDLPISQTAGPACLTDTRAACFTHSHDGAAMAAAHLLTRTFPFVGPAIFEPTIAEQVTGTGAPLLARLTRQAYETAATAAGIRDGAPIRADEGWIVGYRLDPGQDPADLDATVEVLVIGNGEGLGYISYEVRLVWLNGDWRLVAPAWGDWRSSAHAVRNPYPTSYRSYDTIGIGTGGAS